MNIIITGCSSGIGAEVAKVFLSKGAHTVVGIARRNVELQKIQSMCSGNCDGNFVPIPFDLKEINQYHNLRTLILQHISHIDILINNAGMLIYKPFSEISEEEFDAIFTINTKSPYFLVQTLLSLFASSAHIVNISSMGGVQGSVKFKGLTAYSASKAALTNMTESLAVELQDKGIFVNAIALGSVQTEMLETAFPDYTAPVSPEEMSEFIVSFATTGHRYFNGKILPAAVTTP
jgi:NAD(P)-dependent dehydrogenase (short-subunit alcohol dehydrogenase family)